MIVEVIEVPLGITGKGSCFTSTKKKSSRVIVLSTNQCGTKESAPYFIWQQT